MDRPAVIAVSGAPGTGKTTLAKQLAAAFGVPYVGKDLIKEVLFDALGTGDRAWSKRLGGATMEVMFRVVEAAVEAGGSVVVESNFHGREDTPRFNRIRREHAALMIEVHCAARPEVLHGRLHERVLRGERHAGHVETPEMLQALEEEIAKGVYGPLELGEVIRVDTTDWEAVDTRALIDEVRRRLVD